VLTLCYADSLIPKKVCKILITLGPDSTRLLEFLAAGKAHCTKLLGEILINSN
jgi:hypothetical protein